MARTGPSLPQRVISLRHRVEEPVTTSSSRSFQTAQTTTSCLLSNPSLFCNTIAEVTVQVVLFLLAVMVFYLRLGVGLQVSPILDTLLWTAAAVIAALNLFWVLRSHGQLRDPNPSASAIERCASIATLWIRLPLPTR